MADPIRFHLSLNVTNLDRSIAFFRTLFGMEPAKVRSDYAKFEPDEPPLVLSLEPAPAVARSGALNHLGFRMPDARSLVAMQERLERAGMATKREEGVGQEAETVAPLGLPVQPVTWEHRMNEPLPARIPLGDAGAAEVSLRGTLNLPLSQEQRQAVIAEAARVLRPGARLFVHVLTGEQAVESPSLPGPAGAVRSVPFEGDALRLLGDAGFVGIRMLKFDGKPCFVRDGVGMRELQLEARRPAAPETGTVEVMYKGPFRELHDDEGRVFARGQRVSVPAGIAERLQSGEFTMFPSVADRAKSLTACGSA